MQANLDLAKSVVGNISTEIFPENSVDLSPVAFTSDGFLSKPLVAETVLAKPETPVIKKTTVKKTVNSGQVVAKTASVTSGEAHYFPYGYCTYYVSQRRYIPWSGNAIAWLSGAKSYGFATGSTAQVGAIIVTSEGGRTGHVGMIDGVDGDKITITEMNYAGFGVISTRTISSSYGRIMGYIY